MPRPCSICTHPKRKAIEKALVSRSYRDVAIQFKVSKDALSRHTTGCVERSRIEDTAKAQVAARGPVAREDRPKSPRAYEDLELLGDELLEILKTAKAATGQEWLMMSAIDKSRALVETKLKVWETQKRIEAQYNPSTDFSASIIYQFLRGKYPKVLKELVAHIEEARRP